MDDTKIIAAYLIIDKVMSNLGHQSHPLAGVSDAEVLLIGVVAAMRFQNHQQTALFMMKQLRYITKPLSISRFNRRLHALAYWLGYILEVLGEVYAQGSVFIIDSLPLPVCKRKRSNRCRKVQGHSFCGYCASKEERYFGWKLHLVCTPSGIPVAFDMLPACHHDLTPIHDLTVGLAHGACVYADKAYNSCADEASILLDTGVVLIPHRRVNMLPNSYEEKLGLREYRRTIETANSQLEKMGIERLYARTNAGFAIKVCASLLALLASNL
jgi:hypothetical protein